MGFHIVDPPYFLEAPGAQPSFHFVHFAFFVPLDAEGPFGVHKPCPLGQVLLVYELPDVVGLEILDLGDNRLIPVVREFRSNCFLVTLRSWNVLYALEAFDLRIWN